MALKFMTYTLIRKLHLYLAFTLLGSVLMYFLTGFTLTHQSWFGETAPIVETKQYPLHLPRAMNQEELALYWQDAFHLQAKREKPKLKKDGSLEFRYIKPGTNYSVTLSPDHTMVTWKTETFSAVRTLIGFHRLHAYGGGWLYDGYILLMDLTSLALILFALTGVYLWWKLMKRKLLGMLLLVLSMSYTAVIIYLFLRA